MPRMEEARLIGMKMKARIVTVKSVSARVFAGKQNWQASFHLHAMALLLSLMVSFAASMFVK